MLQLVYDGTMAGLLTAVFEAYERRAADDAIIAPNTSAQPDAFAQPIEVVTDAVKSRRVWQGLAGKLSPDALDQLYYCYLSGLPGIEGIMLQYIRYAFSSTGSIEEDFGHPAVLHIAKTAKRVWREKHRMEAFVRFNEIKGDLFYAFIEPDFNVLPLIAPHFRSRYADQSWLIYDGIRKYGLHYNKESESLEEVYLEWNDTSTPGKPTQDAMAPGEELYQQLWKDYFKSTGIASRANPRLHLRHIPHRYWRHLTEKHG